MFSLKRMLRGWVLYYQDKPYDAFDARDILALYGSCGKRAARRYARSLGYPWRLGKC